MGIFAHGCCPAFRNRFPGSEGLARFSLPGYARNGNSAIIYISHAWNGRAGCLSMMSLWRRGGKWKVEWEQEVWES